MYTPTPIAQPGQSSCREEGITLVVPCYNESPEVLEQTLGALHRVLSQIDGLRFEIVAVNDGSTDVEYPSFEAHDEIRWVVHKVNRGYGASLASGIRSAQFPWIGIIDSDGTYPIESFPEMIEMAGTYAMVIGARDWKEISWIRRPAKMALTLVASYLANFSIPDLNSGMRVFHRSIYDSNWRIYPERFSFSSTLTMAALTYLHDVKFVSIRYHKRIGISSIHPLRDPIRFLYQLLRLSLYFRPLRFFLPVSGTFFALALLRGARDYFVTGGLGGLTLILFFMAFQVFFFGLIAEIINKK